MTQNFQLLAHKQPDGEIRLLIHLVYYDENNTPFKYEEAGFLGVFGKIISVSVRAMKEALKKPILWAGDQFPKEFKKE